MQITPTGYFFVFLGLLLFFCSPKKLYPIMIFFIPFSATSVINFGSDSTGSGLQPFFFLGSLFIIIELFNLKNIQSRSQAGLKWYLIFLIFFLGTAYISLIVPLIIDGKILVSTGELYNYEIKPLTLTFRHLTQTLYLTFGILITIFIVLKNRTADEINKTLKIYLISSLIVSLWGLLQFLFYKVGIPYPDFIFNNSASESAKGFEQVLGELELQRISSVAVEPSILAQYFFTTLPFLFLGMILKLHFFSKLFDKLILIISIITLLLSTSSIAYIGFIIMTVIALYILSKMKKINRKFFLFLSTAIFLVTIAILQIPFIKDYASTYLFSKGETFSGLERINSIKEAWSLFLDYPFLGLGWSSVASHDLIVKLLSNVGVVGFISFLVLIWYVLKEIKIYPIGKGVPPFILWWSSSAFIAFSTLLITNCLTGFNFVFGHFWFILSICISTAILSHKPPFRMVQRISNFKSHIPIPHSL